MTASLISILLMLGIPLASCSQTTRTTSGGWPAVHQAQQESAFGPKARIAVTRFRDKTGKGWYSASIRDGMADMLAPPLFNTNRFILLTKNGRRSH